MISRTPRIVLALVALLAVPGLSGCESPAAAQTTGSRSTASTTTSATGVRTALPEAARAASARATGLVGIASGQEAYLHVTRLHPPEPVVPPEPVRVRVSFVGADGASLAESEIALLPGRSETLHLRGPSSTARLLARAAITRLPDDGEVGGIVPCTAPPGTEASGIVPCTTPSLNDVGDVPPDDGLVATLEIVDVATQRSAVVLHPLVVKGFNPQPEPPASR
jgi:hypothetical protein